jgi:uncharacterized protein YraI
MRPALVLGGLVGVFACAAAARAQTAPVPVGEMTITAADVEVRSGPSSTFYPTSKLFRGTKVLVMERCAKAPGWLAVKPPPGSFSWVNARFVQVKKGENNTQLGVVYGGESDKAMIPVLAGSAVYKQKPAVEIAKLKRGQGLVILGASEKAEDGEWLPVQPTEREVRYIPESAVQGSPTTPLAAIPPSAPAAAPTVRTARAQADQAFLNRDYARARSLYEEAANQTRDNAEKSYCYSRLDQIDKMQPAAGRGQAPGQLTANTTSSLYATPPGGTPGTPQWSRWGVLRRTTFQVERRPVYALEDNKGQPLLYATTYANFTLEPYVNQMVCLWGQLDYHSDEYVRNYLMTVSQVALNNKTR